MTYVVSPQPYYFPIFLTMAMRRETVILHAFAVRNHDRRMRKVWLLLYDRI